MFKKLKLKFLFMLAVFTGLFSLTGCANSFFKTKEIVISDVVTSTADNGDLLITITFVDDAKDPIVVTVPKGEAGNGIKNITQTPSATGEAIVVTITYTDLSIPPLEFEILQGVSITSITSKVSDVDPTITIVTVSLSNGEMIEFTFEKPRDGTSILDITQEVNEEGEVILTIYMSDGEEILVTLPNVKGEKGDTIEAITLVQRGDEYVYTFTLSNGQEHNISVNRPATWLSGFGAPQPIIGLVGDYYYDRENNVIYFKSGRGWEIQFDFNEEISLTYYTVTFNLNAGAPYPRWDNLEVFPDGATPNFQIPHGHTFFDTYFDTPYEIPVPLRDGYVFNGWYTQKVPSINSGRFNDLVSVYRSMTLYADWVLAV